MHTMQYRGYTTRIEFDEDDSIFVGHIADIEAIVGFHGTTVDELERAFHESVDAYKKTPLGLPSTEDMVLTDTTQEKVHADSLAHKGEDCVPDKRGVRTP